MSLSTKAEGVKVGRSLRPLKELHDH